MRTAKAISQREDVGINAGGNSYGGTCFGVMTFPFQKIYWVKMKNSRIYQI